VNLWLIGATALLVGLAPCLLVALRASLLDALIAAELAGTVTTVALVLLAEGYHRTSYFTLPIVLAVLTFVGGLAFVRFLGERWL
jgi:multisubunit Na+/H+ antiporter MnhF subunit